MSEEYWVAKEERLRADRARVNRIRLTNTVVGLIRTACGLAAATLVAYVALTVGGANPDNGITKLVADWADALALGFRDLFTVADADLRVIVNYGLAALFWLIVGSVISRILRRLTSPYLIS